MSGVGFILVRHGQQSAGFHVDPDPGLDKTGVEQAAAMAARLGADDGRLLFTSPLRRARETMAALEVRWGRSATVEPRMAEVPTPGLSLDARGHWLDGFLRGDWSDQPDYLQAWRAGIAAFLTGLERPAVIVSHFVVVNAVIGLATGDSRVTPSMPDHCSLNRFELRDGAFHLVEKGAQRKTVIG
ncbi:histidine phosphatase family protein [Zavarzinia aquatilis]|uniref:histidine phosphatase family protein n=1 Tax=Zavarzinia aquatilis TaxID=2211142 RepID=UPI001402C78F|nr:histidine phosphatase family protein [Zavarzinia aquatilis]